MTELNWGAKVEAKAATRAGIPTAISQLKAQHANHRQLRQFFYACTKTPLAIPKTSAEKIILKVPSSRTSSNSLTQRVSETADVGWRMPRFSGQRSIRPEAPALVAL